MPVATLGLVTGIAYGLLAVGLVLAYRASRVINLAQAQIGVLGAALLAVEVNRWQLPYWVVLPTALALAAATGACVEFVVMRRLQTAPRLMTVIATLGAGQVLMLAGQSFAGSDYAKFPAPPGLPQFAIGGLQVTTAHSATVLLSPIVVGALALFLKRSRYGLALRAAADNADAARMASIPAGRMRMLAWALAGAVSAFTAIMVLPTQVSTSPAGFGPGLLVRGLAAALVARMHRLSTALVAGIGVGVLQQAVLWNRPQSQGLVDVALFVVVLAAMLLQRRDAARGDRATAWLATRPWAPLSPAQRQHPLLRHLTPLTLGCAAIATAAIAVSATNNAALALVAVVGFAVVGLSVGVL